MSDAEYRCIRHRVLNCGRYDTTLLGWCGELSAMSDSEKQDPDEEMAREWLLANDKLRLPDQYELERERLDNLTALIRRVREEGLGVDVMTVEEHSLLSERRNADVERSVREVRDEEWSPEHEPHPERKAGWISACDELLRRLGIEP